MDLTFYELRWEVVKVSGRCWNGSRDVSRTRARETVEGDTLGRRHTIAPVAGVKHSDRTLTPWTFNANVSLQCREWMRDHPPLIKGGQGDERERRNVSGRSLKNKIKDALAWTNTHTSPSRVRCQCHPFYSCVHGGGRGCQCATAVSAGRRGNSSSNREEGGVVLRRPHVLVPVAGVT